LSTEVDPPLAQWWTWWSWQLVAGWSQAGCTQPTSRCTTALRMPGGMVRVARPMSSGSPWLPRTMGMTEASQAMRRAASTLMAVPVFSVP
jgi:hypothetical protein